MKKILALIFLIISYSAFSQNIKIKKIIYLSNDVLNEKIMLTYLGFKEERYYDKKYLNFLIELAKLRLTRSGALSDVSIMINDSNENSEDKIVYIELIRGFNKTFSFQLWTFKYGIKNFLNRDDYIGFNTGVNKNSFETLNHLPASFIYFAQETGWKWDITSAPFFPFYPLYGNPQSRLYGDDYYYIHNLFSNARLGFIVHPDIRTGIYSGASVLFYNPIKTRYSFEYKRSGFPTGLFLTIDQRYLTEKYVFGYKFETSAGINPDVSGKNIYPEFSLNLLIDILPSEWILIKNQTRLLSQILNDNEITKFDINDNDNFQRGSIEKGFQYGNFLFVNNFEVKPQIFRIKKTIPNIHFGLSAFYDFSFISNDYELISNRYSLYHTFGGGLWLRLHNPMDINICVEAGYALFNSWKISVGIKDYL